MANVIKGKQSYINPYEVYESVDLKTMKQDYMMSGTSNLQKKQRKCNNAKRHKRK